MAATVKPTLVILAAGIGRRYGGLKQIDPIGPSGEIVIDYSIYDALQAGFGKLVFVIRRDLEAAFRERIGRRYEARVPCAYAFQELDALPAPYRPPPGRQKPWGTGHALAVCQGLVDGPFVVINADDFYGRESFQVVADFLRAPPAPAGAAAGASAAPESFAMVGFRLANTLSEHGDVCRGICDVGPGGWLRGVRELTAISRRDGRIGYPDAAGVWQPLRADDIVSMNIWGFTPGIFPLLQAELAAFLARHGGEEKAEFYLPAAVDQMVRRGQARVQVLPTDAQWFGVTYPGDKPLVAAGITALVRQGRYPNPLVK